MSKFPVQTPEEVSHEIFHQNELKDIIFVYA